MFSIGHVARRSGCSAQLIRNLEAAGALPPVERADNGYRRFGPIHLSALTAYQGIRRAAGADEARRIIRLAWSAPFPEALAALDRAHVRVHAEREAVGITRRAVHDIAAEAIDAARPDDVLTISELATALDVRPSALRHWEAEGLLKPARTAGSGIRIYAPPQVRDARIVDQLRRGGHDIPLIRSVLPQLHRPGAAGVVEDRLRRREDELARRTRALLEAGAALLHLIDSRDQTGT